MMWRSGGRSRPQHEDEDEERVVYYELDAASHTRNLLLSPDAVSAPRAASASAPSADAGGNNKIFPRQQQPLFSLGALQLCPCGCSSRD